MFTIIYDCDLRHRAHDEAKIAASFACLPCQLYGRIIAVKLLGKGSGLARSYQRSAVYRLPFACLPCQLYGRIIAVKFLGKGSGVGLKLSTKRSRLQKFGANFAGAIPRLFDLI